MKRTILLSLAIIPWLTSYSQKVEWVDYVYSTVNFNEGTGVASDNAGNVYTLGDIQDQIIIQGDTFTNQYGAIDLILIKYNPQGSLVWAKVFGSALSDDAYNLSIDAANHLYAEVFIQGATQMNDTIYTATYEYQIIQFDTASNFLRYITRNSMGIISDANGNNVYIAYNASVEKLDTAFNIIWSRTGSNNSMNFSRGGSQVVNGTIKVGNNGHMVVSGHEYGNGSAVTFDTVTFSFSPVRGGDELFVISMDTSGAALWAATLDSSNTVPEETPKAAIDDAGNVYLALYSPGDTMYFASDTLCNTPSLVGYSAIFKYNASGNPQWGIGYYAQSYQTYIYDVLINPQQDLLVCGWSAGMGQFGNYTLPAYSASALLPFVAKVNPAGIIQWYKTNEYDVVGGSMRFNRIAMTPSGNYAVTGLYPPYFSGSVPYRLGCFTAPLGSRDILTFVLSEDQEPVPDAGFNLLYEGGEAYFENTSVNFDTLKWVFGDSQTDNIRRNPSHAYPVPGVYNACLIATNGCGSDSACTTILVEGIEKVTPKQLAISGFHIVNITGGFPFSSGMVKFIKSGEPDIVPEETFFINSGLIKAKLKAESAALGNWDLVIISGSFNDTLFNAITLEHPNASNVEIQVLGTGRSLVNNWWPYKIMLTNKGNQTEIGIPLYITISPDAEVLIKNPEIGDSVSIAFTNSTGHWWHIITDSVTNDSVLFGAFLLPYLTPGEPYIFNMLIRIPNIGLKEITARAGNSYFDENELTVKGLRSGCNFLPNCVQCAMDWLGFVPGVGCVTGAFSLGCTIGNAVNGAAGGGALDLVGATAGAFLSCAGPLGALDDIGKAFATVAGVADFGSSLGGTFDDCGVSGGCYPHNRDNWIWPNTASCDPNSKTGPLGITPENYISGEETMHFTIHFENVDTATAPAREVVIHDTLDASVFDVSTFRFTSFAFGDSTYTLDVEDNLFATDIDLRPTKNIILRVIGFLDTLTNVATCKFQSFDTLTYELTMNVDDGFLPPNINRPEGEGYITYSIEPVQGLQHLQQLTNTASIVFDANPPIETELFINTVDSEKPSSQIDSNPVMLNDTTFVISWSGTDTHAGINVYDIYISVNDRAYFQLYKGTAKTWARITSVPGDKYELYSVATDLADNREETPTDPENFPDLSIFLNGIYEGSPETPLNIYPNPAGDKVYIELNHDSGDIFNISLYDITSKLINNFTVNFATSFVELDIKHLKNGFYFITLSNIKSGIIQQGMMVKLKN